MIILRGVPGCGKSTLASLLNNIYQDSTICSNDAYMYEDGVYKWSPDKIKTAVELCYNRAENAMLTGIEIVIIDNTHCKEEYVKKYTDLAEKYGYQIISLVVENRHGNKNIHNVNEETINNMRYNLLNSLKL